MRTELAALLGTDAVEERPVRDLWPLGLMRARAGLEPVLVTVARPRTYEEVATVMAWASNRGVRVVPLGGGSGVCGAIAPGADQLVLDLGALDRIMEVDAENLRCRVQAGVGGMRLEEILGGSGLTLGHFPSSLPVTTVGGLISTRSSGQQSTRYGNIEDMVLGLGVVLADGTRLESRSHHPRSAAGPTLDQLWVGAEGALGVVVEADLRIHRRPAAVIGRGYCFVGLEPALVAMRELVQLDLRPLVLRLYDREDTAFQGVDLDGGCLLVVACAGEPEMAAAEAGVVARIMSQARDLGDGPWERWLHHRFDLSAERLGRFLEPPGSFLDTIEVAASWDRLLELHGDVKAALAGSGIALCHFSHAYPQGCCAYFTFAGSAGSEAEAEAAYLKAWEGAMAATLTHRATITHHHGVGQVRAPWIQAELGAWWGIWEAVRHSLDPGRIMNPNAVGGLRGCADRR